MSPPTGGRTVMSRTAWDEAGQPGATVSVTLEEALKKSGMTVTRLAEVTGLARNGLDKLKNARSAGITWTTLAALCSALDCHPGDLIRYEPPPIVLDDDAYERFLTKQNQTGQAVPGALPL